MNPLDTAIGKYCPACHAIPKHGYCNLAGCPTGYGDLTSPASGGGERDGWKLVPIEPTEEMVQEGANAFNRVEGRWEISRSAYAAMLAAAPAASPPPSGGEREVVARIDCADFLQRLRTANTERSAAWTAGTEMDGALFRATELGGEVGEVLNVVKKLERAASGWRGSTATVEDLGAEIGDVLICLDRLASHYGIDIAPAVAAKFNATSEKVGLPQRLAALRPTPNPGLAASMTRLYCNLSDAYPSETVLVETADLQAVLSSLSDARGETISDEPSVSLPQGPSTTADQFADTCEDGRLRAAGYFVCSSNANREWHWHGPDRKWHDHYRSEDAAVRAALRDLSAAGQSLGAALTPEGA